MFMLFIISGANVDIFLNVQRDELKINFQLTQLKLNLSVSHHFELHLIYEIFKA